MIRNSIILLIIAGLAVIFYHELSSYHGNDKLNETAEHYATNGLTEVGAANLVTSVVVTYRGLDTLGEVTILFLTAAILGFMFRAGQKQEERKLRSSSEILMTASNVLLPVIFLVGIYIFINGHLTPGGGFQGGAVLASAVVLMILSLSGRKIKHVVMDFIETISGIAFVLLGILGIFLAGGFLDNSIFPLGTFGELLSAGAIPVIYSFVGLKVGAELSNIILVLNQTQNEAK
ncbi:MAG: hydrogen gas-evolving membrane-bound hydrogenase subunit E [Bacteroidota bacterium]